MKKERKMKKVLFPILALVLALALALPMAAVVGAAPDTATFGDDPGDWQKTENRLVDDTTDGVGDAPAWTDGAWGSWVSPAWDGPSNGIYGHAISYWVEDDTWVMWSHEGTDWDEHTDQWFRTTVDIPATWSVTSVELLYKYNEAIIPINDDLYVYVDDKYVAAGGTAGVLWLQGPSYIGTAPPDPTYGSNTFVAAVDPYSFAVAPETGWYLDGGLDLPPELFTPGSHDIHVLGEEFDVNGGLGHLVIKVEYDIVISIEVEKDYRYTNVCFERDNDLDGLFNEDPVEEEIDNDVDGQFSEDPVDFVDNDLDGLTDEDPSEQIDNDGDGLFGEDPVDCPLGTSLGYRLPMDAEDNYHLEAVIHPKNNKVMSYNPGQYYAVSTVNVLDDVDTLTILEDWSACDEISTLNPKKGGGRVVIVQVGPGDDVAYQILDANMAGVTVTATTATAVLTNVSAGTTILMYVKFGPGLKGETWVGPSYGPCENYNWASVLEEPDPQVPEDWITASANLIVVEKE